MQGWGRSTARAQPLRLGLRSLAGDASRASSLGASRSLLRLQRRRVERTHSVAVGVEVAMPMHLWCRWQEG